MITLTKVQIALLLAAALVLGTGGAMGYTMYAHHNLQHYLAEQDHLQLQALDRLVGQLIQIEQQRQQGRAQP